MYMENFTLRRCTAHPFIALATMICTLLFGDLKAQETNLSKTGWFYLESNIGISNSWSLRTDLHLRSTDNFSNFGNLLFRNWLNYSLSDAFSFGFGYTYLGSWHDEVSSPDTYFTENRPFQQLQYDIPLNSRSRISQRVRLEQRFFDTEALPPFSLRSRYAINWKNYIVSRPLGISFIFLENEMFFNMIGQRLSGNKLFEQNRVYGGFGFGLFSTSEIEVGSYYEINNDVFGRTNRSLIFQLGLKTNL